MAHPSRPSEPGLQGLELGVDLLGVAKLGDLLVERPGRSAEHQRVGAALGMIHLALELVEAGEGLVDPGAGGHLAEPGALVGAFEPALGRALPQPGLAQLALELGDVGFRGAHRLVEQVDLGAQALGQCRRPSASR